MIFGDPARNVIRYSWQPIAWPSSQRPLGVGLTRAQVPMVTHKIIHCEGLARTDSVSDLACLVLNSNSNSRTSFN